MPLPDIMPFDPNPSNPRFRLPTGACDSHCHVFGPAAVFPFAPERKYTPHDAPKEKLFALHRHLGVSRGVIVQATCHGADNRALVDALVAGGGTYRGIATVKRDVTPGELADLDGAGVKGVRFNFVRRLVEATPRADFLAIVDKIAALGWHVVVYLEAADLGDLETFLTRMPLPVVVDHMGRPDVAQGIDSPSFRRFRDMCTEHHHIWVKVTGPERVTVAGPPYDDVVRFAQALVEDIPDRVLWGTDWPHPNMVSHMPDDGALVDFIPRIATSAGERQALLVDNPARLYW